MFQQHDGRVRVGDLEMTAAEFATLRPNFPALPKGEIYRKYDGIVHKISNGKDQSSGPVPWTPGDELLLEETILATELATLREALKPPPPPVLTDTEILVGRQRDDVAFRSVLGSLAKLGPPGMTADDVFQEMLTDLET